jgi:Zn-dependent peptidase ImmA (M78 family)
MARLEATPNPAVLVWARKSAGLVLALAAKKAQVTTDQLDSWERGTSRPSLPQLRRLAGIYRRPLAAFYLPEPPTRFEVMHDFRQLSPSAAHPDEQPDMALEIRRAHDRREWALEMMKDIDETPPEFSLSIKPSEDIESAATKVRNALKITTELQRNWSSEWDAFKNWRQQLEKAGVLTFQATKLSLDEARGFSISQKPLPVVVANIKDAPRGRIFTLLHEVAHIGLNEGGICDFHDADVEAYCNRVASAALFPKAELMSSETVRMHRRGQTAWSDNELRDLSRRFGGSREAALVRLLSLGLTTQSYYDKKREEFIQEYRRQREERKEGFAPPHIIAISSAGPLFTSLVVENLNREHITASDVSDYLQIRMKHVANLQTDFARSA